MITACNKDAGRGSTQDPVRITASDSTEKGAQVSPAQKSSSARSRISQPGQAANATSGTASLETPPTSGSAILVSGKVTYPDGKPATSATVTLMGMLGSQETGFRQETLASADTSEAGDYAVRGDGDILGISLRVTGDVPQTELRHIDADFQSNRSRRGLRRIKQDIVLAESYDLAGRVINEKGEAMPGVAVHVQPLIEPNSYSEVSEIRSFQPQQTTTTVMGDFRLPKLAAGKWTIGSAARDYATVLQTINIPTTEPVTLQFSARGGSIAGRVHLKADGSPVANVPVILGSGDRMRISTLENFATTSSADGRFQFDHVSSSPMNILVHPEFTKNQKLGMAPPRPGVIKVSEGETTEVMVFLYPGHTVTGLVFDKDTSDSLAGALVKSGSSKATSDEAGNYRLENLFGGENASISASLEGYKLSSGNKYNQYASVALPEEFDVPVVKNLPMERQLTISGKVITADGVPVAHATVKFVSARSISGVLGEKAKPVQSDGSFKIEAEPFDDGFVVAEAGGFGRAQSALVELTTEDKKDVEVKMEAGATVQGTVVDAAGSPVPGAKIQNLQMYSMSSGSRGSYEAVATSGEDGTFTITDAASEVNLNASKEPHAQSASLKLDLKPGETRTGVQLKLRTGFSISGRVIKSDKSPVASARVHANGGDSNGSANSEKDGRFEIKGLAEGVYRVYAYANSQSQNLENIKAGTTDLEIVIDDDKGRHTLIGTVVDEVTGKVITDFDLAGDGKKLPEPGKFEKTNMQSDVSYSISISSPNHEAQQFMVSTSGKPEKFEQTFKLGKGGIITGRVVEKGTGKPLSNVTIINWGNAEYYERGQRGPTNHSVSGEDGRFTLAPAPNGKNNLIIKPQPPLAEVSKSVVVQSEETADAGNIEVSAGCTVRGRVVRGQGDDPVPGKSVALNVYDAEYRINKTATTDADGRFEFTGIPPTHTSVQCGSQSKQVLASETAPVEVTFRVGSVTVTGKVTRGGMPVAESVSASGPEGMTYSSYSQGGSYKMEDVLPGKYEFAVGSRRSIKVSVDVPDQAEFQKDFVLPDGRIRVMVVDPAGQPVRSANVSLTQKSTDTGYDQRWLNQAESESTKLDGTAEYLGLTPGTYSVSARKEGVGSALNSTVQVADGQSVDVRLQLESGGGTLVSIALSSATGQGIPQAWCYLYSSSGSFTHTATRDGGGIMTITDIPPGTYTTNVSYWSHSQAERSVEIKAGETVTIEDVLYPAGAITWTLRTAGGQPASGATISLTPVETSPPDKPRSGRTDSSGRYVERGLAPGTYSATAQLPGKPATTQNFTVAAGGNAALETSVPGW